MADATLVEQLRQALAPAYVLERELGRGASATVFLAVDAKHGRKVALKVLHADLAASMGPKRFRREIAVSARFQHPHILSVHDSGETATGLLWYTMPYVNGESLRDRLRRDGALPVTDAIGIAGEIADALGYAHAHGVVHRDVKPENILLSDGHALLADFGVARAASGVQESPTPVTTQLTEAGLAVGTPQYMSPEQLAADPQIDARSDVYALGVVLYETLAGEMPFGGPTAQATMAKIMSGEPPSLRRTRRSVPPGVDAVIRRALSPAPADRFADGQALRVALERAERAGSGHRRKAIAIGVTAAAITLAIGLGAVAVRARASSDGVPVLAILPFENEGDAGDAYFADGITDDVRGKLAALRGLRVIASGSTVQYRHTTKSAREIARELGARYLLVGRVRWQREPGGVSRVHVRPELVQVGDGPAPIDAWSAEFDANLSDVFAVQSHIATLVADTLGVTLGAGERVAIAQEPTANLDAYDAYLRGKADARASSSASDQRKAIESFARAVTLDPQFALAWASLSQAYSNLIGVAVIRTAGLADSARRAAGRAVLASPNLPEGHAAFALYDATVAHDLASAEAELAQSRAHAPNDADLLGLAAYIEERLGRWTNAVAHHDSAVRLDPRDATANAELGFALIYTHRYAEARAALDRALILAPSNLTFVEWRVMASLAEGDLAGARAVLRVAAATIDQPTLIAYLAAYRELAWVLDTAQRRTLVALPLSAFDNERSTWAMALADGYFLNGDSLRGRAYSDSARLALEVALRTNDTQIDLHLDHATTLAYLGRRDDARREGERALSMPASVADGRVGPFYLYELGRIEVLAGNPAHALDIVNQLLARPGFLSPGWLTIDPNFAPIRSASLRR